MDNNFANPYLAEWAAASEAPETPEAQPWLQQNPYSAESGAHDEAIGASRVALEEKAEEQRAFAPSMSLVARKDGTKELVMAAMQEPPPPPRPWASNQKPSSPGAEIKKKFKDAEEDELAEVALAAHEKREKKWGRYYNFRASSMFRRPLKTLIVLNVLLVCMDLLWDAIQPLEQRLDGVVGWAVIGVFGYTYLELLFVGVIEPIVFQISLPPAVRQKIARWPMLIIEYTIAAASVLYGLIILGYMLFYRMNPDLLYPQEPSTPGSTWEPVDTPVANFAIPLPVLRQMLGAWFIIRLVHLMIMVSTHITKDEILRARNNFVVSQKELHAALENVPRVSAELYSYVENMMNTFFEESGEWDDNPPAEGLVRLSPEFILLVKHIAEQPDSPARRTGIPQNAATIMSMGNKMNTGQRSLARTITKGFGTTKPGSNGPALEHAFTRTDKNNWNAQLTAFLPPELHAYAIHGMAYNPYAQEGGIGGSSTTSAQRIAAALSKVAGDKSRMSWAANVAEILTSSEGKSYGVGDTILSCVYWLAQTPILSFLMLGLTIGAGYADVEISKRIGQMTAVYGSLASCTGDANATTVDLPPLPGASINGTSNITPPDMSASLNATSSEPEICFTQLEFIWPAFLLGMLIIAGTVARNVSITLAGIVTAKLEGMLSDRLLKRVCQGTVDSISEGDISSRFSKDITKIIPKRLMIATAVTVFSLYQIMVRQPRVGLTFLFCVPATFLLTSGAAVKGSKKGSVKAAILNGTFINSVRLRRVMGLYDCGDMVIDNAKPVVDGAIEGSLANELSLTSVQFANKMVSAFLTTVGVIAIAAYEYQNVVNGTPIPDAVANVTIVMLLVKDLNDQMRKMADGLIEMLNLGSPLQRLDEIARHTPKSGGDDDAKSGAQLPALRGEVQYKDVKFSYPGSKNLVLKGMSAVVPVGEYTCVVGGSGAGKSTLMSLITREQKENSGFVGFDGNALANVTPKEVRKQLGVVMQETAILNGSVAANIRMGRPDATDDEVRKAADLAEVTSFVDPLPGGFDTVIGSESDNHMSGGQLQRICLARALIRNPRFLLLDEATSALDAKTEATIINTVVRLVKETGLTCMSITHKMPTTVQADKILGLKLGKVAEFGSPGELLKNPDGVYTELMSTTAAPSAGGDDKKDKKKDKKKK
eukprot:jgi/Tetstr1/466060/TSEL_010647.t1